MKKAAFLDRDGVINRKAPEGEYILRWEEFQFLPGVAEAIKLLNNSGILVIVVSNQRCVSKGLLSIPDLEEIHRKMQDVLSVAGARLDAIYFCPHDNFPPCDCRKPAPGMLLSAAKEHGIDLSSSWMIGDTNSDMEAGKRAGCKTIKITPQATIESSSADESADSLLSAVHHLLRNSPL